MLANHVLYFLPDLDNTLAALLGTLAIPGLFLTAMAGQQVEYTREDVHYDLVFPDAVEHRLTVMRFLLGHAYHDLSQPALLALFDPYVQNGQVAMRLVHEHFIVQRHAQVGRLIRPSAAPRCAAHGNDQFGAGENCTGLWRFFCLKLADIENASRPAGSHAL